MAHNLHIDTLVVDGELVEGSVRGGVMVPISGDTWIVHAATTRPSDWELGSEHDLRIDAREGLIVEGRATLKRSDGMAHYFVGDEIPEALRKSNGAS